MMKRTFPAVAVLAAALLLSGCGAVDTDGGINPAITKPTVTETSTAPAPVVETSEPVDEAAIAETAFLATVRNKYPIAEGLSDATLIALATAACGAFDRGATRAEVIAMTVENGGEYANVIAYAVGAGVAAYCPEYKSLF